MRFIPFTLLALSFQALAKPVPLEARDKSVVPLSNAEISSYSMYAKFVGATYCSGTVDWSCKACKLIPGFVPYATGGNGGSIPLWYVGWWPTESTVVVAHEGTEPLKLQSLLTDLKIFPRPLSPTLFPNVSTAVKVHSGFRDAHAATAVNVLAAVKKVIAERNATKVTVVGHSLGGAVAALESLYLTLNLPGIFVKGITYGQPRVGNREFADWIDRMVPDFSRITNKRDLIPILPARLLGFCHAGGEKHVKSAGVWNACVGQDNTSAECSTGAVSSILIGNLMDHLGPYEGTWMGFLVC